MFFDVPILKHFTVLVYFYTIFFFPGRVINKLKNHEDEDIQKAAKKVYIKWRTHFVEHMERPMMEVQCDAKTEKLRSSGRNLLADSLSLSVCSEQK